MDTNTYGILQILLTENRYVTYQYLSQKLKISNRTVKRAMPVVTDYLEKHSISYKTEKGKGTRLFLDQERRDLELQRIKETNVGYLSHRERRTRLICELFLAEDYLSMDYFSLVVNVSPKTAEKDLEEAENWFQRYHLEILKERGKGSILKGSEENLRTARVNFIYENLNRKMIHFNAQEMIGPNQLSSDLTLKTKNQLLQLIHIPSVERVRSGIEKYDKNLKYSLVDESYIKLILMLSSLFSPSRFAWSFSTEEAFEEKEVQYMEGLLISIFEHTEGNKEIHGPTVCEKNWILDFYSTARRQNYLPNGPKPELQIAYLETSLQIITAIKRELDIELDEHSDMLQRLRYHLSLFFQRLDKNIKVSNEYVEQINREYPGIFCGVKKAVERVLKRTVNDSELAYISMYIVGAMLEEQNKSSIKKIVVVCMSGVGTSKILEEMIKRHFPQTAISHIDHPGRINELTLIKNGIDLIISSVHMTTTLIPSVVVNPFLSEHDQREISRHLYQKPKGYDEGLDESGKKAMQPGEQKRNLSFEQDLDLFHEITGNFYFEYLKPVKEIGEIIEHISEKLTTSENKRALAQRMIERERFGSTVIDQEGILLLHCKFKNVIRLGVVKMEEAFFYDTLEGKISIHTIVIMIIPEIENPKAVEMFSAISSALVTDPQVMKEIKIGDKGLILKAFSKEMCKLIY